MFAPGLNRGLTLHLFFPNRFSSPMKIFYLARINIATEDASTRHVFEFCRQFAGMGHEVILFVPDLGERRELEGVRFVHVPVVRGAASLENGRIKGHQEFSNAPQSPRESSTRNGETLHVQQP